MPEETVSQIRIKILTCVVTASSPSLLVWLVETSIN